MSNHQLLEIAENKVIILGLEKVSLAGKPPKTRETSTTVEVFTTETKKFQKIAYAKLRLTVSHGMVQAYESCFERKCMTIEEFLAHQYLSFEENFSKESDVTSRYHHWRGYWQDEDPTFLSLLALHRIDQAIKSSIINPAIKSYTKEDEMDRWTFGYLSKRLGGYLYKTTATSMQILSSLQ